MDMINRIKQNRAQRPSNRSKFKENNRDSIYSYNQISQKLNFKTVPEKELNQIKKQIRERAEVERKRAQIIYGIVIICSIILLIGIIIYTR